MTASGADDDGVRYICWCSGTACDGRTTEPFTVCEECKKFGHEPMLVIDSLRPEDVMVDD